MSGSPRRRAGGFSKRRRACSTAPIAPRDWGTAIKKYLGLLWACFALLALTALTASADPITGIYRITPRVQPTMCLDINNFANAKRKYREWNDRRHLPGQRQLRPALVLRAHRQRLVPDRSAECRNQLPANPGYAQRQQRQRGRLREYLQRLWRPQPVVPPGIPRTDQGSRQLQEGSWRTAAAGRRAELRLDVAGDRASLAERPWPAEASRTRTRTRTRRRSRTQRRTQRRTPAGAGAQARGARSHVWVRGPAFEGFLCAGGRRGRARGAGAQA